MIRDMKITLRDKVSCFLVERIRGRTWRNLSADGIEVEGIFAEGKLRDRHSVRTASKPDTERPTVRIAESSNALNASSDIVTSERNKHALRDCARLDQVDLQRANDRVGTAAR